jgi:hypothetical protein
VRFYRSSKQFVVPAQRIGHRGTLLFPMLRAALDVSEEEGHRPARKRYSQRHGEAFKEGRAHALYVVVL